MRRFASLYFLAWVPYLGLYSLIFWAADDFGPVPAFFSALTNVAPAALAGLVVVRVVALVERIPDSPRMIALHAAAAITYALATAGTSAGIFIVYQTFWTGSLEFIQVIFFWQAFVNVIVYVCIAAFTHAWNMRERLQLEQARAVRAEQLRTRAELEALRARLKPHFLFNTLHSLLALVRRDPDAAEDALERFGDLLRYALNVQCEEDDEVTLGAEWGFVSNYLELERLRLHDRLRLHASIDASALGVRVPPFSLQPLVENAIHHAVAPRAGGATVWIDATVSDGVLTVEISDDGPGSAPAAGSVGLGLELVKQRLELRGDGARLDTDSTPGKGFRARVWIPLREAERTADGRVAPQPPATSRAHEGTA